MSTENFKNCPVIVYDSERQYITKAVVTEHNKTEMTVFISNVLGGVKQGTHLSLMIILPDRVCELEGIARLTYGRGREVSIFNERQREARASQRHKLDAPALIKSVVIDSVQHALNIPLKIVVNNMSSTGVLITTPPAPFVVGTVLGIELNFNEKLVMLFGSIVREQINDDGNISFGCKLVFYNK